MESKPARIASPITKKKSEFYLSGDSSQEDPTAARSSAIQKYEESKTTPVLSSYKETQKELKERKKKGGKTSFVINTRKCHYEVLNTLNHVVALSSKWGETRTDEGGDLVWYGVDLREPDVEFLKNFKKYFNRYPNSGSLCHKRPLAIAMGRMTRMFPECYEFSPPTFLYPQESKALEKYTKAHPGATYLVKTSSGSAGEGIILINKLQEIPEFLLSKDVIIQRYLASPLLLKGKKFDLRVYVVFTRLNPVEVYLCDQGLARFCTQDYEKPTKKNMKDHFRHLTNYSLNKLSDDYVKPDARSILQTNDSSKRTLESMWKSLDEEGVDTGELKTKMEDVIRKTVIAMEPSIMHEFRLSFGEKAFSREKKVFQIFGFDLLFDEDLNVWLLEINANPSMNMSQEIEQYNGTKMNVISPIDEYVKTRVITDTIKLVKHKDELPEKQRSLEQVLPNSSYSKYYLFHQALQLYEKLSGVKQSNSLTSGKFAKLAQVPGLTGESLKKVDYDLIFKKALLVQNTGVMNFDIFVEGLFIIVQRLRGSITSHNFTQIVRKALQFL